MTEEVNMRLRLQNVAAYRELRRTVQRSGRENVVFALVMFGIAYFSHTAGAFWLAVALYGLLAAGELLVGLIKWAAPSAEGVLFDAIILLMFAGWNIGWQGLAAVGGGRPNPVILFLGLYMLFGAISRFKAYANLRRLFAERPAPEHIAWFDDLVRDILTSDPHTDQLVLDLPTTPHWRVKLLGSTAFFVANNGNAVWVAGPEDFTLVREARPRSRAPKALLRIYGEAYPEFTLEDVSWSNYSRWMAEFAAPHPA